MKPHCATSDAISSSDAPTSLLGGQAGVRYRSRERLQRHRSLPPPRRPAYDPRLVLIVEEAADRPRARSGSRLVPCRYRRQTEMTGFHFTATEVCFLMRSAQREAGANCSFLVLLLFIISVYNSFQLKLNPLEKSFIWQFAPSFSAELLFRGTEFSTRPE